MPKYGKQGPDPQNLEIFHFFLFVEILPINMLLMSPYSLLYVNYFICDVAGWRAEGPSNFTTP